MKYLKGLWILIRVLFFGLLRLPAMLEALIAFTHNRKKSVYALYNDDRAIASRVYGTKHRTISGICGKYKKQGRIGYTMAASVIDYLAVIVGDEVKHCERADDWEIRMGFDE